jgi:L-iditol 2-dehydrogenase
MQNGKMKAMLFLAPGKLEYREVKIPEIGASDILVKVRTALTCGTDVKTFKRGHPKYNPPTLFGHEFGGDVFAIGSGIRGLQIGTRVVAGNTAPCNTCYYCKHGQQNLCEDLMVNLGAFAEFIRVPGRIVEQNLFTIPADLDYGEAALVEPLGCVIHGQDLVKIELGDSVAVVGAGGPIGLMHLQVARHNGAGQVIAIDINDARLEVAHHLGATRTINSTREDPKAVIREMTAGRGADVVIESAGALAAWQLALDLVRKGGRVLWFGGLPAGMRIELDTTHIHYDEISIFGVYHLTPLSAFKAFELLRTRIVDAQALITAELPLARLEEALEMMGDGRAIKVAIVP